MIRYIAPVLFILSTFHTAQAQIPAGGTPLTPGDFLATARRPISGSDARSRIVDIEHEDFSRALRVEVLHEAGDAWSVEIGNTTIAPVARGDVALIHFWARGTESSDETGEVFLRCTRRSARRIGISRCIAASASGPNGASSSFPLNLSTTTPRGRP